jgi:hypothetical protein
LGPKEKCFNLAYNDSISAAQKRKDEVFLTVSQSVILFPVKDSS